MRSAKSILWIFVDLIFPWAEPLSKQDAEAVRQRLAQVKVDCEERLKGLPDDKEALNQYLAECVKQLEDERSMRQGIEGRLTSMIGLSSIAGTIVLSGILAEAAGTLRPQQASLRWIVGIGLSYLTIQLCGAMLAAVRGLRRRSFLADSLPELLPGSGESNVAYLRRRIGGKISVLDDLRERNNDKVTEMAIAHRAMINFVCGLLLFALLVTNYGITTHTSNDLVDTLKKDHGLIEMLRGPQGVPGPPGPQGPKGDSSKVAGSAPRNLRR